LHAKRNMVKSRKNRLAGPNTDSMNAW
jgi:hypothetical protein